LFDIGTGELLALAVLALLVLGPDKLPRYAAEAARFLRQLRTLASDARSEVQRELGTDLDGLDLRELNPRNLVRKHVLDGIDLDDEGDGRPSRNNGPNGAGSNGAGSNGARRTGGEPGSVEAAPYDPDTT
jgi:sec-independent protein translocase protein TatB